MIIDRETLGHLRVEAAFGLLPTFLFALSQTEEDPLSYKSFLIFIALQLFLYPACHAYNGYYDKDTESIVGLENPSPPTDKLYYLSIVLHLAELIIASFVNFGFFVYSLVFTLVSMAYSHPSINLKGIPMCCWLLNSSFYGYLTTMGVHVGLGGIRVLASQRLHFSGILTTMVVLGGFPLTQVYQHGEDKKRGIVTISSLLGVPGTFYLSVSIMGLTGLGFGSFFHAYYPASFYTVLINSIIGVGLAGTGVLKLFRGVVLGELNQIEYGQIKKLLKLQSVGCNSFFGWLVIYTHYYYEPSS